MDNDFATENTYWRGSITVPMTSCLFCLELAGLLNLNEQQFYLFGQMQTCQNGGQSYSDTSPLNCMDEITVTDCSSFGSIICKTK